MICCSIFLINKIKIVLLLMVTRYSYIIGWLLLSRLARWLVKRECGRAARANRDENTINPELSVLYIKTTTTTIQHRARMLTKA